MKKVCFFGLIAFCLMTLESYGQIKWDLAKFMPLSEVKPGMKGEAYTVFSDTKAEKFNFEVVSIEYNFSPQWHVIWVQGSGENYERTGVAGGMSGSPGYINGRLMGALSLGYFNQREYSNIAGFTPIESMIDVTHRGMTPKLGYRGGRLFNYGTDVVGERNDMLPFSTEGFANESGLTGIPPAFSTVTANTARLEVPIAVSAMSHKTMEFLTPILAKYRLHPLQAAGGSSPVKNAPIEPGQIIGTEFARGDFSMFGYGTMTYVENNQVIGFGHSAFGEGNVNLPISGGYVHFILPSISRSFKVAGPTRPIGTMVQDRQTAIAGVLGSSPNYIPVKANIETTDGRKYPMQFDAMRHQGFSALITMLGALNLLDSVEMSTGDHTINVNSVITLKDQPNLASRKIVHDNVYSSSFSPGFALFQALSPLSDLIGNSYAKVSVEQVTLNLKLEDQRKTAVIEALRINKDRYRPGEVIEVTITLRPYLESPIIQTGHITIP
ncbi:MAG: hypothetical protein OXI86_13650, partial [Candidatus Poribacteria bacterium]|nr:hypothetical protein [Candidatus Poribacteria bacterium]